MPTTCPPPTTHNTNTITTNTYNNNTNNANNNSNNSNTNMFCCFWSLSSTHLPHASAIWLRRLAT